MTETKYKLSNDLVNFLADSAQGYLSSDNFNALLSALESEASLQKFLRSSEPNLIRIVNNRYDRHSFLNDLLTYPHHIEILLAIAANSNYLTDIVVANPEYLNLVFNPSYLDKPITRELCDDELSKGINNFTKIESKLNYLRLFKKRVLLKIGLNDILGRISLTEATEQLSHLANSICSLLFELTLESAVEKNEYKFNNSGYTLISLGKLGGNELNYSSDVDFMLISDPSSTLPEMWIEVLSEAAQLFINYSSRITPQGFLYRVDFRLRPDGRHSPMCRSLKDTISYYETRGSEWEKQMLLKSGFTGGNVKLFSQFINFVYSYSYRTEIGKSPLETIGRMKLAIEENAKDENDIKLSAGGIRDIEFSVQALQMINGKNNVELRSGNTLTAIGQLKEKELISEEEYSIYTEAYKFYRKIEHYLQLMNNVQTHRIPSEGGLAEKLALFLGFPSTDKFFHHLSALKTQVRNIFNSITGDESDKNLLSLSAINFSDRKNSIRNYQFLKTGLSLFDQREFDQLTINYFEEFEEYLIDYLTKSNSPDRILKNLSKAVRSHKFPSTVYREFRDKNLLNSFLLLMEYSQLATDIFTENKNTEEILITRRAFNKDLNELFRYVTFEQLKFIVCYQFTLGILDGAGVGSALSEFLVFKLKDLSGEINVSAEFFIAGLGSFGSAEMTFGSDMDLIFIVDRIDDFEKIQSEFQNYLTRLKSIFPALEIDCRLRPEGKNSQLVWDIAGYEKYLADRARVWEYQALSKLNYVCGNKNLFDRFKNIILKNYHRFDPAFMREEILGMYKKVKSSSHQLKKNRLDLKALSGGLTTIDFTVQIASTFRSEYYVDTFGLPLGKRINYYSGKKLLPDSELSGNYTFLKNLQITIQSLFNMRLPLVPNKPEELNLIAGFLKFESGESLKLFIKKTMKENEDIFRSKSEVKP